MYAASIKEIVLTTRACFEPLGVGIDGMQGRGTKSRHSPCAEARQSVNTMSNEAIMHYYQSILQ